MTAPVRVELLRPGIAAVTLDRPERRNALSIALLKELVRHLEDLHATGTARVVILRGAGPVFSAGLDLAEASNPDLVEESALAVAAALHTLRHSPLVSIATVQGGAYAGGAGLMAACDIAVAADDAKIGFPEARRGLLPALICEPLREKVRAGDLAELFLVGDAIDAQRARLIGLVQHVVPPERLAETALALAAGVLAGGPKTIEHTKALLRAAFARPEGAGGSPIAEHLAARRGSEAIEGLRAFLEKRPPAWGG